MQQACCFCHRGLHSAMAEVHGTAWLEKKICLCVPTNAYMIIHKTYTCSHTYNKMFKYSKCIIFTLHANLSVQVF